MDHVVASKLVDRIYECGITGADWGGVLNEIANVAHADVAWLVLGLPDLGINSVVAPRSDPSIITEYQEHWWRKDPTILATSTAPVGQITSLGDTGRDRFVSSEFFGECWRRSGYAAERLATNLVSNASGMASIGIQPSRRSDSIEPELAETFAFLIPHLVRSVQVRCAMRRAELELEASRQSPKSNVLLVDADARLIVADHRAGQILAGSTVLRIDDGRVGFSTRQDTTRLHRLIRQCRRVKAQTDRGSDDVWAQKDDPRIQIDVVPFQNEDSALSFEHVQYRQLFAMLVIRDPVGQRRDAGLLVRERFGLAPAEAEVALELMRGRPHRSRRAARGQPGDGAHSYDARVRQGRRQQSGGLD